MPAVSPYAYASNDPLNTTDPLGLFSFGSIVSAVVHTAAHFAHSAAHAAHAIAGTVTRGADILAGATAHAFEAVHAILDNVAATARKDAARVAHLARDAATRVVNTVRDAVSRSAGIVRSAVNDSITWIKKHNQIIGRIGAFLSNVSGDLALAGLIIAPIPGLDALTPVLEGAAAAAAIGALATQGIARAAGDENITYGDLFNDALAAIPGGGDAEDAERGLNIASHITEDASDAEDVVPVLRYPGKSLPDTAENMARYMNDKGLDETSDFVRVDTKARDANRSANRRLYQGNPSMEEFPFASTAQGGAGAYLKQVSIEEQRAQGRLLADFYRVNSVRPGDRYAIWIDWDH